MKLPRTLISLAGEISSLRRQIKLSVKRMALLCGFVLLIFLLVIPFIGRSVSESRTSTAQKVATQAKVSVALVVGHNIENSVKTTSEPEFHAHDVPQPHTLNAAVFAPPISGKVLRETGNRLIWWSILEDYRQHIGSDIAAPIGTKVKAPADGTVSELGNDPVYGTVVVVDYVDGWRTVYGGLAKLKVKLNAKVKAGQPLAEVGAPAGAEADLEAHLHYELWHNGQIVSQLSQNRAV
ncbi:MAG TPA: M23 family metallopeptidase [Desulfobacteria bacterium]|nr:M23 family metallopeptidase [Desulfobacteria bacterium]